jgi:glc operon protein GlcG
MSTFIARVLAVAGVLLVGAGADAAAQQVASKHSLTLDGARRIIAAAKQEARSHNEGGVIAVVDDGGNLIALERLDETFAAGARISIGKARTAALFKRPTRAFEDIIKNGRTAMVALEDFTPLQGGVPVTIGGQVVGAVGVSGAASAQRDEEVALAGLRALGDVAGGGVRPGELERAKENLKGRILLSLESTSSRMSRLGKSLVTNTELLPLDELVARVDAVTTDDVAGVAADLLRLDRLSAAGIGPSETRFRRAIERVNPSLVERAAA